MAIDATGVMSFNHQHCDQCLHRTSKGGKTTWFHQVLEAKLITPNGFALSLGTEWIENPTGEYDKQDCERNAFRRLAEKLKRDDPPLPICLTADGLYPYQGFFDVCRAYNWRYLLTFKEGCLPSVWAEVESLKPLQEDNHRRKVVIKGNKRIMSDYRWVTKVDYKGYSVHWLECLETLSEQQGKEEASSRFVHLTDLEAEYQSASRLSEAGRMRWKIENEGFNAQKNQGYGMSHPYARQSCQAMKNYYQVLQIAHLINQLLVLSQAFQELLTSKMTLKHLWKCLERLMSDGDVDEQALDAISVAACQVRFVT